jgi:hypothetical protein
MTTTFQNLFRSNDSARDKFLSRFFDIFSEEIDTEQGRTNVIDKYGLKDVLSLKAIINDLVGWQNQDYTELVHKYETCCGELFTGLRSFGVSPR